MRKELTTDEHGLTQMESAEKKLPEGWEKKRIGDFLRLEYGKPLKKRKKRQ